jgi:hypothetical protein
MLLQSSGHCRHYVTPREWNRELICFNARKYFAFILSSNEFEFIQTLTRILCYKFCHSDHFLRVFTDKALSLRMLWFSPTTTHLLCLDTSNPFPNRNFKLLTPFLPAQYYSSTLDISIVLHTILYLWDVIFLINWVKYNIRDFWRFWWPLGLRLPNS